MNARPQKHPAAMRTPSGVQMSDRAARIYGWLNARGISLTTFSTDDCVERCYPALQAAHADLTKLLGLLVGAGRSGDLPSDVELDAMVRDLESIMSRRPAARVPGAR